MIIKNLSNVSVSEASLFYRTKEWKQLRDSFLLENELVCLRCGSDKNIRVDHIKPVRYYWDLRLEKTNLQILCNSCNLKKASNDHDDFLLSEKEYNEKRANLWAAYKKSEIDSAINEMINNKDDYILRRKRLWLSYFNDKKQDIPQDIKTVNEFFEFMYNKELRKLHDQQA